MWDKFIEFWPVAVGSSLMITGAVIDGWKLKVPNWLTFPTMLLGWLYWSTQGWNSLGLSLLGTLAAFGLCIGIVAAGLCGAGDCKLYMGFGAWIVPYEWFGFQNLLWAFAISVIVGGVMGVAMIWWSNSMPKAMANMMDTVESWKTSKSIEENYERAKERKSRQQLLPYGIPLTIGSLAYMLTLMPALSSVGLFAATGGF